MKLGIKTKYLVIYLTLVLLLQSFLSAYSSMIRPRRQADGFPIRSHNMEGL